MKCILLETKDKKKFLTEEKNLEYLQNFINAFEINVKKVIAKQGKILTLKELASILADPLATKESLEYNPTSDKISHKKNSQQKPAILIRSFIYSQLCNNKIVSLNDLKEEFKKYQFSDATFYNHLRKVKESIEKQGFEVKKISPGKYKKTN